MGLFFSGELTPLSVFLRLLLSAFCGGIIGIERGAHGRPAGLRTFSLVCLGSCLVMITNEYLTLIYGSGDPARLAAQVISGMGFLGAGTILVTGRHDIKGLTTAAGMWATACLGITFGSGFWGAGLMGFVMIMGIMLALSALSHRIVGHSRKIVLYLEVCGKQGLEAVNDFARENSFRITGLERQDKPALRDGDIPLIAKLDLGGRVAHGTLAEQVSALDAVHYCEEV